MIKLCKHGIQITHVRSTSESNFVELDDCPVSKCGKKGKGNRKLSIGSRWYSHIELLVLSSKYISYRILKENFIKIQY